MKDNEWDELSTVKKYFEEVISPFSDERAAAVIRRTIGRFASKRKTILELGCGIGVLVPFMSENFKKVFATDYSQGMVNRAMKMNRKVKNVNFKKKDMRKLNYNNHFDVIVMVNSLISPSIKQVSHIISNIYKSLKERGVLVGVIPSMEYALYAAMLVYERESQSNPKHVAVKKTKEIIGARSYDFMLGFVSDEGKKQKHFYEFEIEYRLRKAGFKKIKISKIYYSWDALGNPDAYFPTEKPIWDWLVVARK